MATLDLTQEIEHFAEQTRTNNSFFLHVSEGSLTPVQLARFLYTAYYLVLHTPIHLHLAKDQSVAKGNELLAAFFDNKIKEEFAHQVWAVQDLTALMKEYGITELPEPVPAVKELASFITDTIRKDPALYLPYILLAEYFTVLVGPYWTKMLAEKCHIPASLVSIIGNHVELDKEHVDHDLEELRALLKSESQVNYDEVLRTSMSLYDRIYHELGEN